MIKDIFDELLYVLKGNTLDVLVPPILFYIGLSLFDLVVALIISLLFALSMFVLRIRKQEKWYYALFGILGALFAAALSYLNNNASNFFLPDIIGTGVFVLVTTITLMIKKPLAMWASHITRGWDIKWFLRDDIYPAYFEVTVLWLVFFVIRLVVEVTLYLTSTTEELVIANIVMGLPLLVFVLTLSYVYGLWRLKQLKGPGIEEYLEGKEPPFKGQRKGF